MIQFTLKGGPCDGFRIGYGSSEHGWGWGFIALDPLPTQVHSGEPSVLEGCEGVMILSRQENGNYILLYGLEPVVGEPLNDAYYSAVIAEGRVEAQYIGSAHEGAQWN